MTERSGLVRPAVIELSVLRGRTNRVAPLEWLMLLRLARSFGWEPVGAEAFDDEGVSVDRDLWYGLTCDDAIAYRAIGGEDANRLGTALARGAAMVARESDVALLDGGAEVGVTAEPTALDYFVEQGLAADWIEQLADDLTDTVTLLVHGDMGREWREVLGGFAADDAGGPWGDDEPGPLSFPTGHREG